MNVFEKVGNALSEIQGVLVSYGKEVEVSNENVVVLKCGESYKESEVFQGGLVKEHDCIIISIYNTDFLAGYNTFVNIKNVLNKKATDIGIVHYKDLESVCKAEKCIFSVVYKII